MGDAPNTKRARTASTTKAWSLQEYLKPFYLKKGDDMTIMTNTRIGDKNQKISGGSFAVPNDQYHEFLNLYFSNTAEKDIPEYMTEKQLLDDGPILVDVDLRYVV